MIRLFNKKFNNNNIKIEHLTEVPDSFYEELNYPKEGKCSDIIHISNKEADNYYEAAKECFHMVDKATEYVIENKLYKTLGIPEYMWNMIEYSYNNYILYPHMLGRFDFAGGLNNIPIKLIEFNADTPFSIFEVSSVQYALAKYAGYDPDNKQFNTLFESLVEFFKYLILKYDKIIRYRNCFNPHDIKIGFTNHKDGEDDLNTIILKEAAEKAIEEATDNRFFTPKTYYHHWTDIAVEEDGSILGIVDDPEDTEVPYIYTYFNILIKMIPWDLLILEDEHMCKEIIRGMENFKDRLLVINPPYTCVYQNKGLMVYMKELFPKSPYLLDTRFYDNTELPFKNSVIKPIWGREGQNIKIINKENNNINESDGFYKNIPTIVQEKADMIVHENNYYQAGVFISMEEPCGLGFRRSNNEIITTDDCMVGHIID